MYIQSRSELRRRLAALVEIFAPLPIAFKGDVTNGVPTVANLSTTEDLAVGESIAGPGIPLGTTILQLGPGNTLTMSNNATLTTVQANLTAISVAPAAQVHLFAAVASPGPEPTPASFTEANFDTYTALPLPVGAGPYSQADGSAEIDYGDISWTLLVDPVTPNSIFGYWVDYLVSGVRTVAFYESFDAPMPMTNAGNAIVMSIPVKEPPAAKATVVG